jgi:hypothetical protein
MNKKRLLPIAVSLVIIAFTMIRIHQIDENHEKNLKVMEACMDEGGTVTVDQAHLFSLTDASCMN